MVNALPLSNTGGPLAGLAKEAFSLLVGASITLGLLASMAYFENREQSAPNPEYEDLHAVSVPPEAPPPPIQRPSEPVETVSPLTNLDVGASESPVKIAVVPPDLAVLIPIIDAPPAATIKTWQLYSKMKPRMEIAGDFQRVFQQSEVDQIPKIIYRPDPQVSRAVRNNADKLRVVLLLTVDVTGLVASVRIMNSSGNKEFDTLIARSVKDEWSLSPAIKKGKKVKCLLQQSVLVIWSHSGSALTL